MSHLPLHSPIRVHPFSGLVIDVDTWATAHDYHRTHQRLHLLSLHGSGVAQGLEVVSTDPPSESVVVEAGVAIDPLGNTIIVSERQHVALGERPGTTYLVLDYVESIPPTGDSQQDTRARVKEDFRLRAVQAAPEPHSLELARIEVAQTPAQVVSPGNPWLPGQNEIDQRHRPRLHVTAPRRVSIALVIQGDENALNPSHLAGFQFLLREMEYYGLRAEVSVSKDSSVPESEFVYVTGDASTALPSAMVARLSDRVAQGAWLFVDACGSDTGMVESCRSVLTATDGRTTEELVLSSRFVFGTPPPGAFPTRQLLWGQRTILSPRDYGCAWSGRRGDHAFQRDLVRDALEFGVNAVFCAGQNVPGQPSRQAPGPRSKASAVTEEALLRAPEETEVKRDS